jgi:hypothetical protein
MSDYNNHLRKVLLKNNWHWRVLDWQQSGPFWRLLAGPPIILVAIPAVVLDVFFETLKAFQ